MIHFTMGQKIAALLSCAVLYLFVIWLDEKRGKK
jgi:hypothetical protein